MRTASPYSASMPVPSSWSSTDSVYGARCGRVTRHDPNASSIGPERGSVRIRDGGPTQAASAGQRSTPSSSTSYVTAVSGSRPVIGTIA